MIPKITFTRSHVYDEHLARAKKFKMPSDSFIYSNTSKLEKRWKKYEKIILQEISKVTGLKWQEEDIYIYITSGVGWFSMPLTMSIVEDIDFMLDTMVHELIHRIFSENQNWLEVKKNWLKLMGKYNKEKFNTRTHVPIHAIHKHLMLKFFNQKRLDNEIERCAKWPIYKRSWEIVERDDYHKIISQLKIR